MQTPENVLGALIKQIVRGLGAIPDEIDVAFRKAKGQIGGRGLRVPEALSLLKAALAPLDRTFICIDALDELLVKHLPTLLSSLHDISQSCPAVRILFTGRPHIGVEIKKYFPGDAWFLQMNGTRQDIMRYVEMMLDYDPNPEAMNAGLRAEIMNQVSGTISDVYAAATFRSRLEGSLIIAPRFLLVSLKIAAILDQTTIHDRREQLKRMTSGRGLNDVYGVTLDRIKGQSVGKSKFGMAALMWISRSKTPMSPGELCHALGVQIGSANPNLDSIPSMQTLLASCLGLVTLDGEESKVRLVHFSLQEYLNGSPEIFQNPYAVMAEICLTYLNFDCIRKLPPIPDSAPHKYPFLCHASYYWGHYARHETTDGVKSLALQLLDGFDSHVSASLLLRHSLWQLAWSRTGFTGFTGLHCVAYLGVVKIAEALLDMRDWDVDGADPWGRTPLIWASINGHEGIIRLLLEKTRASLDTGDTKDGQTPFSWAAKYGNEGVAKLLLERAEVDTESRDVLGRTPLSHAAGSGREGTIKLLLEWAAVNPESRDNDGRTPLSHAAEGEAAEGAIKLLLEWQNVNPESRDNSGRTPFSHAAGSYWGKEAVTLLLEREDVNPESRDNSGRTPLSHAAGSHWRGAYKLHLERQNVNPESQDNPGGTPLSDAARAFWGEGVVKLLLARKDVNPESRDNNGRTPLSHAACSSWGQEAATLLLEREDVNPESRDNSGRTPLSHAAETEGGDWAIKLLLERLNVNPESRDNSGRTPLSYAAANYRGERIVKLLLKREEVNPESRDDNGRTPLSHAVDEEVVKLLLEREEVNPESRDNFGRTPLSHAAASHRGELIVKLLLKREEVNPESRDNSGRTPRSYARWGALTLLSNYR